MKITSYLQQKMKACDVAGASKFNDKGQSFI
jgi:hypothetical protein